MKPGDLTPTPELSMNRITIPKGIIKEFMQSPRILLINRPDGIWPVPPELLNRQEFWNELMADEQFTEKFEVVIMQR